MSPWSPRRHFLIKKRGGFGLLPPLNETSTIFSFFQDADSKRSPYHATGLFLYWLKTSENQGFVMLLVIL